jgi:dTMP kinase
MLIAIEGIDGSGKGTQTQSLVAELRARGRTAETLTFPQYGNNPFAEAIAQYLRGEFGDVDHVNPTLAALLYACDRYATRDRLLEMLDRSDVAVCDRYVASNIAYQAAKLPEPEWPAFAEWIGEVEFGQFALPRPSATFWLDVPVEVSRTLVRKKGQRAQGSLFVGASAYMTEEADIHERNLDFLARCRQVYAYLAQSDPRGQWRRIDCAPDGSMRPVEVITAELVTSVERLLG